MTTKQRQVEAILGETIDKAFEIYDASVEPLRQAREAAVKAAYEIYEQTKEEAE